MAFNIFTTKRVFCFDQHHGINDLITCNLRGAKCTFHQQFLVREFHFSALYKRRVSQVYVAWSEDLPTENYKIRIADQIVTFRVSRPLGVPSPCRPCERHMPIKPRETPIERIFWEFIGRKILHPSATYGKS